MTLEREVGLAPYTSLRVGGTSQYFVLASTGHQLAEALGWARDEGHPVRVVGGGSNLLVADPGVDGLVIKIADAHTAIEERHGEPVLIAAAGATFANVARRLAKDGFGGLEWAANVPGTVGGAVVNNAGAFGSDTASCLLGAEVVDDRGRRGYLTPDELEYAYRTSVLKRRELGNIAVERVDLRLIPKAPGQADSLVKEFNAQRMRTQPRVLSAGSVFANPEGDYAGRLIESAGLKGITIGGAQISEQHANFIVNPGGATARDVYELMRLTQQRVFDAAGVWLKPEIELFGRWTPEERAALVGPVAVSHG
jgi:UDP-N-acetylmuramate dehydrogenase